MSNWIPNWNPNKYQKQVEGEESKKSSHVLMANHEVTELTWENGQLSIHDLCGLLSNKPTWSRASDTLESFVNQATSSNNNNNCKHLLSHQNSYIDAAKTSPTVSFSTEKYIENQEFMQLESRISKKRMRVELDPCMELFGSSFQEEQRSACFGSNAALSRENDVTTMMTWNSLEENPPSLNVKARTTDEDSGCQDGSENMEHQETKGETSRSNSTRRNRAAANHNQSERRRRDRINQKMKALQRLIPNASKSDKASMLDEVIEYLKQLQTQVKMMNTRTLPQMMIPALEMQQQMQMFILARMGMGVGLGMSPTPHAATQSMSHIASATTSPFFPSPFMMPSMIPNQNATAVNGSPPFNNPYCPYFTQPMQPMNMDLYNNMAAIYQQQVKRSSQPTSYPLPQNNVIN